MNKDFFVTNRKKVGGYIDNDSLLILFSGQAPQKSADENYNYVPNMNFYYMTGLNREKFILIISKYKGKVEEKIFIEKPNTDIEKWIGKRMRKEEVKELSGIGNVMYIDDFESYITSILMSKEIDNIYLDLEKRRWEGDVKESLLLASKFKNKYPFLNIENIYHKISDMRTIKSEEEIKNIKNAINITKIGIENLMKNAKSGMFEYQLEAYFDFAIKTNGAKDYAFKTIAASGNNATVLHYEENNSKIKENDLILFDLGAKYNYYSSDISRTFPVNGIFTSRQREVYEAVLKAEIETINKAKPGMTQKELNEFTKRILIEEAKKLGIIEKDEEIIKYYYHGVSHYMGLDTHDVGSYNKELEVGMVITIEPGLYIEDEGIGIRIEDNILITENGCENLSKDIIKTVEDIEEFMKNR
ncbi:aminopeptidase P family protein [Clostridium sp. D2Q-14]|uniref:aminopeptidase P family protein n=1 Tax=Anaeromonas gelatinilytica TaxID=2683194 RepID=UPI00193C6C2F|nr:aminopeptidase P family protein [Anaeromonas gelatinilytica]MBS4534662.1 aminopeptidase P family protein [Anaeromonas gelatinilytica]